MIAVTRYALIGATGIGGYHLAAIQAMALDASVLLVAVTDPALAHPSELRSQLLGQGVRIYRDYREMLEGERELDVVVISAPIPFHLEMALACLDHGVFIYLEKPPVPLIQQLETMIAADVLQRIGVGFQMIHAGWVQRMKQAILQGRIGRLLDIRIGACWPRLDSYYSRNASAGKMSVEGRARL